MGVGANDAGGTATPGAGARTSLDAAERLVDLFRRTYAQGYRALQHGIRRLHDPFVLVVFLAFLVYGIYWSYLTLERFYALYASVYDLGLTEQKIWWFVNPGPTGPLTYLSNVLDEPFEFIMLPTLVAGYPGLLVLQSFALGSGSLPLFGIARKALRSPFAALCVALAYLVYFPMGGVNWFDVHFVAFFIPLFLLGFYLMVHRSFRWAAFVLLVAGSTEYPIIIVVVLFALTLVLEAAFDRFVLRAPSDLPRVRFSLVLLAASGLFLAFQYVFLQNYLGPTAFASTAHSGNSGANISLDSRVMIAVFLLAPALFLTLLTPRWLVMLAPTAYIIFGSTYAGYSFPEIFQTQYSAIYIPVVFLGVVYTLQWIGSGTPPSAPVGPPVLPRRKFRLGYQEVPRVPMLALVVLGGCLLFASIFQPYGLLNLQSGDSFFIHSRTDVNGTNFDLMQQAESLVPRSTPFVVFQNDMPGMLPRPLDYLETPEVAGVGMWQNVTPYDAERGSYPYLLWNQQIVDMTVDYMIDDPYSWGFLEQGSQPNNSMVHFIQTGYESGSYGILGEVAGMMVLERGYTGAPVDFVPLQASIPPSQLGAVGGVGDVRPGEVTFAGGNGPAAWNAPFSYLSPGTYRIQFSLMTSTLNALNHVTLSASGNGGQVTFGSRTISAASFPATGVWVPFDLTVQVGDTYGGIEFSGTDLQWLGSLSIQYIEITQTAPGTPTIS